MEPLDRIEALDEEALYDEVLDTPLDRNETLDGEALDESLGRKEALYDEVLDEPLDRSEAPYERHSGRRLIGKRRSMTKY